MTTELLPLIEYVPEPMRTFLNTPPLLGQFVPCDEEGNVMDEPDQAAKDRVVFDGFEKVKETQDGIVIVSDDLISIAFYPSGTIESKCIRIKTISDLCGYGLKLKQR